MDPTKVEAIHGWPRPTFISEIKSFIRLAGCYRWFVEGFYTNDTLLSQRLLFVWSNECGASFLRLKELLTTTPIWTLPIEGESFVIYYDASYIGLGYVLIQRG